MRRTSGNSPKWMEIDGKLVGLAMGSDFCAEHEWGVKRMRDSFGLDETKDGMDKRIIRMIPEGLVLLEEKGVTALFFVPHAYGNDTYESRARYYMKDTLKPYREESLVTAWDESSFGITAYGTKDCEDRKRVREVYEAFQNKDIGFWPNVGPFHLGGGLIFAICSRVPDEQKKEMLESDLDYKKLLNSAALTGIEAKLRKADIGFFALSPKWANFFKNPSYVEKTKHDVIFWLNPCRQDDNNYGYFTVEELELWIEGKGPIPKKKG